MEIYPSDENQTRLVYNFLVMVLLVGAAIIVPFVGWLPFGVAAALVVAIIWDMYLRPWLRPETEVDTDTYWQQRFGDWLNSQEDKYKARVIEHEAVLNVLRKELAELKEKVK